MYKAIIFDLDGTLLNTSRDINKVLNDALRTFGCPELSLEKTIEYVGNGAKKLLERAVPAGFKRFDELYKYYLVKFAACDNALTSFYDGEEQFFAKAKQQGIKTAILSNKPDDAAHEVYKKFLARFSFDYVLGQTPEFGLKPDPSAVIYLKGKRGVEKSECLFVGDGETDVATAANAGIDCASVLWGFRTEAQLKEAGAKLLVHSYSQLWDVVSGN